MREMLYNVCLWAELCGFKLKIFAVLKYAKTLEKMLKSALKMLKKCSKVLNQIIQNCTGPGV